MYEFIEDNPETWRVHRAPLRDTDFDRQLVALAGTNPHSQPILRIVWGGTELTDRTKTGHELKYHCGWTKKELKGYRYEEDGEEKFIADANDYKGTALLKPVIEQEPIGYPRWIIEKWVSPEELAAANRFKGGTEVLRDFPREGIYEPYFIVEDAQGNFRPLGQDVLEFIKLKWNHEQQVKYEQRERERKEYLESEALEKEKRNKDIWNLENDFRLPQDEIDRRALMEENERKSIERAEAEAKKLKFYGSSTSTAHSAESANS